MAGLAPGNARNAERAADSPSNGISRSTLNVPATGNALARTANPYSTHAAP
jgi:hypothetical protein